MEQDNPLTMLYGDCREVLKTIPDKTIQCCITSPPYFGLRSYLPADHPSKALEIGSEATPAEYVAALVDVFREVRRVLKEDGCLFLNLGDSYTRNGGAPGGGNRELKHLEGKQRRMMKIPDGLGLAEKNLIGIPWRVAFALQDDGWILRNDIIWHKSNAMPESVTDRCTRAHEYLFHFVKQPHYYYDAVAIAEPAQEHSGSAASFKRSNSKRGLALVPGNTATHRLNRADVAYGGTRNKRTVWTIPTRPCGGAHFAVMPEALVEPCILAASRPGDLVLDPFAGSGTVGRVALKHHRRALLIELNEAEYAPLLNERTDNVQTALDLEAA